MLLKTWTFPYGYNLILHYYSIKIIYIEENTKRNRVAVRLFADLSDVPENLPLAAPGSESPQALNYSQIASAAVAVSQAGGNQDPASVSSTETLLRNIQGLLKVAADNARQLEKQINYEKGQWQGFLKTLEGALHNFIIYQLSQSYVKRPWTKK